MSKIKKIIAILLVVLFLVTVTAGAASAMFKFDKKQEAKMLKEKASKAEINGIDPPISTMKVLDDISRKTITATRTIYGFQPK